MAACEQKMGGVSRRSTGQECTQFGRAQERRDKTRVSADTAIEERGGATQNDDVQGGDAVTELVYRKVARSAGGEVARRFGADPPKGQ
jgi:hypothetical protein